MTFLYVNEMVILTRRELREGHQRSARMNYVCVWQLAGLVSVGSRCAKLRLILLRLKYSKCILLADSPIIIHTPTFEMLKGPGLWVLVHWRLVYDQEACLDCSVDGSSTHLRNGTCVPVYRALYARRLRPSKCITCQTIHPNVKLGSCCVLILMYYTRWFWNKIVLSKFFEFRYLHTCVRWIA
jgi:hypothetical protein